MTAALSRQTMDHGAFCVPWFTLYAVFRLGALFVLFGAAPEALVFDKGAIADGQWWRLVTGHLVHVDAGHLLWNAGAFLVMGFLLEGVMRLSIWRHAALLAGAVAVIDAWLWFAQTDLTVYAGFSAVLNAQFIVLVALVWRDTRSPLALLLGAGGLAKTLLEMALGVSLLTDPSWPPVPEAHLAGLVAGLAWLWLANLSCDAQPTGANLTPQEA